MSEDDREYRIVGWRTDRGRVSRYVVWDDLFSLESARQMLSSVGRGGCHDDLSIETRLATPWEIVS